MESNKTQKYLGDLVKPGFYDELVIMGFPYDQGARNQQLRAGSYLGPDSFRRFLVFDFGVLKNVEYGINIEEHLPQISDYGNIQTDAVLNGQNNMSQDKLQALYEKLTVKSGLCLDRNNRLFVVGGTKDMLPAVCKAYSREG
jgi:hypothetical protein